MMVSRGDSTASGETFAASPLAKGEVFGASPVAANGEVFVSDTPRRLLSNNCRDPGTAPTNVSLPLEFASHARGVRGSSD